MSDCLSGNDHRYELLGAGPVGYVDPQSLRNFAYEGSTHEWLWRKPDRYLQPLYTCQPLAWQPPGATPPVAPGQAAHFWVAVRRSDGVVDSLPAAYFNRPALIDPALGATLEPLPHGWYATMAASVEPACRQALLGPGDDLLGWYVVPGWNDHPEQDGVSLMEEIRRCAEAVLCNELSPGQAVARQVLALLDKSVHGEDLR